MTMRERCAAAMYDDNLRQLNKVTYERASRLGYGYVPTIQKPFQQAEEHVRSVYLNYVDAMLDELTKPSEAVINSAFTFVMTQNREQRLDQCAIALIAFQDMIKAIKENK